MFLLPDTDDIQMAIDGLTDAEMSVPDEVDGSREQSFSPAFVVSGASDPQCGRPGPGRGPFRSERGV